MATLMRPGTPSVLSAALLTSLMVLAGCGSSSQPPADSTPSPAPEDTAGEDAPEGGEQPVAEDAAGPAQKDGAGKGSKADPMSAVEQKVGAAVESVMGRGACSEREEFTPGTPLSEWSRLDEGPQDDGLFGPLEGALVAVDCVRSAPTGMYPDGNERVLLRFFTDSADVDSDFHQPMLSVQGDCEAAFFTHDDEKWTAYTHLAEQNTMDILERTLGAAFHGPDDFQP